MKNHASVPIFRTTCALALLNAALIAAAHAQGAPMETVLPDFPADAQSLDDKTIEERLRDQVYVGKNANGVGWRAQYTASGYVFIDLDNGARDSGTWRVVNGRVCAEYRRVFPSGCAEVRAGPDALYSRRDNAQAVIVMRKP